MYSNEPIKYYKNRGGKPDRLSKWLEIASVLVWLIFIINISLILYAKPGNENFFDRLFNVHVRNYWDIRYLRTGLLITVVQLVISAISLYLNTRRLKRKYDRMRISLWISTGLSLILGILLLIIVLR